MVRHPELFLGMDGVLQYKYFNGTNSQIVCKIILDFYEEYKTFPTFAQIETRAMAMTRQSGDTEKTTEITAYLQKLSQVQLRAPEEYKAQAVSFARSQAILQVSTEVVQSIAAAPDTELLPFVNKMRDAVNIGMNLADRGLSLQHDYNKVVDFLTNKEIGTFTGYDYLDTKVWRRGWGKNWLIVPLAPPKRYKTAFCLNLAMNMVGPKCGYDVIYYTCEISEYEALGRCYQNLLAATSDEMHDDPDGFKQRIFEALHGGVLGRLVVKFFPAGTATINDIRAHAISTIQSENLKVKAIFIDYADTIKPNSTGKEQKDYIQQADIYTDARALGCEIGCPVIMPDRCNRETINQAVPTSDSFQGAFEKGGIVDVGIGLCATDEEYEKNIMRLYVFFNRHGASGYHIRGKIDPERMIFTVSEELKAHEVAEVEDQVQAQRERKYGRGKKKHTGFSKEREDDPRLAAESPPEKPKFKLPKV
jgi:replicative DNA helicase